MESELFAQATVNLAQTMSIAGNRQQATGNTGGKEFSAHGFSICLCPNCLGDCYKTESRSKGFELNIDLSGMENKGVTDYKDNPILPGEKVDRYRFMLMLLIYNKR
jgi:hypothetical protein